METILLAIVIVGILGGAGCYVYRARQQGNACIGCPCGGSCGGNCGGDCSCGGHHE